MTADVQVFLYPEELDAISPDALAEQILELGCNAASIALVYHRGRRVLPRQARISALTTVTTYFEPERSRYGALAPAGNGPPHLRECLFAFRAACARAGLGFRAWIVALHQDALAAAFPTAASRTLDGSTNGIGLCPSALESMEFVEGLIGDVCSQFEPELVEIEAALYPAGSRRTRSRSHSRRSRHGHGSSALSASAMRAATCSATMRTGSSAAR